MFHCQLSWHLGDLGSSWVCHHLLDAGTLTWASARSFSLSSISSPTSTHPLTSPLRYPKRSRADFPLPLPGFLASADGTTVLLTAQARNQGLIPQHPNQMSLPPGRVPDLFKHCPYCSPGDLSKMQSTSGPFPDSLVSVQSWKSELLNLGSKIWVCGPC